MDFEKFRFTVLKKILMLGDEPTGLVGIFEETDNKDGTFSIDPKKHLGFHTTDYTLVRNSELIDCSIPLIEDMGLEIQSVDENWSWTNKRRMFLSLVTNKEFSPTDDESDKHNLTLNLYNSYDGSLTFGVDFGTYRQVCSNGMMAGTQIMSSRKKHYVEFDPELVKAQLMQAVSKFDTLKDIMTCLQDTNITSQRLDDLFEQAAKRSLVTASEKEVLVGTLDQQTNGYAILNMFTWYLSHIAVGSYERKRKLNQYVFNSLTRGMKQL